MIKPVLGFDNSVVEIALPPSRPVMLDEWAPGGSRDEDDIGSGMFFYRCKDGLGDVFAAA